jgi:hypothetical protein
MRQSTYRNEGLFYYRGGVGLHAATARGQSQTLTSRHAAPPETVRLSAGAVAIILFTGLAFGGETGFWITLLGLVAFAILLGIGGASAQNHALQQWSSTFRCGRCGTVFVIIDDEHVRIEARDQTAAVKQPGQTREAIYPQR